MIDAFIWSMSIVLAISLFSYFMLYGVAKTRFIMDQWRPLLISFAVGVLYGTVFFHFFPLIYSAHNPNSIPVGIMLSLGVILVFASEKAILIHRCYHGHMCDHTGVHAMTNIMGDALHNFIDGIVIATSFLVSIPLGLTTAFATSLHEIPKEFADFTILINSGLSTKRALFYNLLSGLVSILGVMSVFLKHSYAR